MRLPAACLVLILACLRAAAGAEPPPYDHYDPVALNEQAVRAARDGDETTALILLERAVRIFPQDRRIAANLETLRAWREGRPRPARPRPPPAPAARTEPPEPPALWPAAERGYAARQSGNEE
ncbi:MAG TPA: hypothetical protein VJ576_09090 [Rhodocyclaceae bacterium]|nr:hypothetical protein [Rhodocyclaceae bacterium]